MRLILRRLVHPAGFLFSYYPCTVLEVNHFLNVLIFIFITYTKETNKKLTNCCSFLHFVVLNSRILPPLIWTKNPKTLISLIFDLMYSSGWNEEFSGRIKFPNYRTLTLPFLSPLSPTPTNLSLTLSFLVIN